MTDQLDDEAKLFGKTALAACQLTYDFVETLSGPLYLATEVPLGATDPEILRLSTIRGYFNRMYAWMDTVRRLNASTDVQAVASAERSLFEMLVDMALLHLGKYPFEKMFAWERSAALRYAKRVLTYFDGKPMPAAYEATLSFVNGLEAQEIIANRQKWWNGGTHPRNRWTGNDLSLDVTAAQALITEQDSSGSDYSNTTSSSINSPVGPHTAPRLRVFGPRT